VSARPRISNELTVVVPRQRASARELTTHTDANTWHAMGPRALTTIARRSLQLFGLFLGHRSQPQGLNGKRLGRWRQQTPARHSTVCCLRQPVRKVKHDCLESRTVLGDIHYVLSHFPQLHKFDFDQYVIECVVSLRLPENIGFVRFLVQLAMNDKVSVSRANSCILEKGSGRGMTLWVAFLEFFSEDLHEFESIAIAGFCSKMPRNAIRYSAEK
jgi:hypothetical protein